MKVINARFRTCTPEATRSQLMHFKHFFLAKHIVGTLIIHSCQCGNRKIYKIAVIFVDKIDCFDTKT